MLKFYCLYRNSTKKEKKKESLQINETKLCRIEGGLHAWVRIVSIYFFDFMFFIFIHFFPPCVGSIEKEPKVSREPSPGLFSVYILLIFFGALF